jgi:hypothetical protein
MMNINLHIERLVLDGLPVEARHGALLKEVIAAELERLLEANGLAASLQTGGVLPRLPAASIQLGSEKVPTRLGQQIAQTVYASIGNDVVKK